MQTPRTHFFNLNTFITALFYLLFLITPLYFRFVTEELFEFNKMILVYGFTGAVTTLWILQMIVSKKLILNKSKLDLFLGAFFASQLLSTVFSIHTRTSLLGYYSRFHGGLASTLSYIVLYYAFISLVPKKHLKPLFAAFISSTAIVSIWGIFEHFGSSFSCAILTGKFDVACWVQDVQNRVYASFGQPNWMAAFLIAIIPVVLAYIISRKTHWLQRYFLYITLGLATLALLYTKSRSGVLGLVGGLGTLGLLTAGIWHYSQDTAQKTEIKKNWSVRAAVSAVVLVAGIMLLVGTPYSPSLGVLFSSTQPVPQPSEPTVEAPVNRLDAGGTDSGEIRKIVWRGAIAVWQRYPLLGSGVETFGYSYYRDRPDAHNMVSEWDFLYNKAHNELLNYLATTGFLGLATYVALWAAVGYMVLSALKNPQITSAEKLYSSGLFSGLVALFISNFFGFSTVTSTLVTFIYFAYLSILTQNSSPAFAAAATSAKVTKKQHPGFSGWQYFAYTATIVTAVFFFAQLHRYWSADVEYAAAKSLLRAKSYQQGITTMQSALLKSPNEALFYDTYSNELAALATTLSDQEDATAAAQVADTVLALSDTALSLNPAHLNFYKTRTRVLITLTQIEPSFMNEAKKTLLAAEKLTYDIDFDDVLFVALALIGFFF